MAEFEHTAKLSGKTTNREQLDPAAKAFGEWIGALSKDGVLALAGAAGAKVAPKVMPKVETAITSKVGAVRDAVKQTSELGAAVAATPEGVIVKMPKGRTTLEKIHDPIEARWEHRINLRKGDGSKSSGMEYAWKRHGGGGTSKKSQFTISRAEVETILQDKKVITSQAIKSSTSSNYIRQVDVGKVVGEVAAHKSGQPTSVITVITDEAGNLVNVFPGTLDFKTTLPK